ncbi:MAG: glycosyl transferase family 2 [Planctomycetaceae bacterium]|nr:glycosyl transferase family 2 [Planctomycetaceae bacterium]
MVYQLTAIITCKDEENNIRECIESVLGIADEVLIADSGSTDRTLAIIEEEGGCRVIEREYINSGSLKNWAIPQATHEWVFVIDADERVTPRLAAEIEDMLAGEPSHDGYWVNRDNYFLGHPARFGGFRNDNVIRLFRRDLGRYKGETDHCEVAITTNRIGFLKGTLQHFSYWSYDQYMRKFHRYTTYQAQVWAESGKSPSFLKLAFNGPFRFVRDYFFKLGFLDGKVGLQVCMLSAFYSFMKQARLWELQEGIPEPQLEADREQRKAA